MKLIRPSKLSDDEYVAWIREKDRSRRRSGWAYVVALLLNVAFIYLVAREFRFVLDLPHGSRLGVVAFVGGAVYGGLLAFLLLGAIGSAMGWWEAKHGQRTERLVLKYYDQAQTQGSSNNTHDGIRQPADGSPKPSA